MKNELKITFSLSKSETKNLSGFEYGSVYIEGKLGNFSTDELNKTLMISLTIMSLLDGIVEFTKNKSVNTFRWETVEAIFITNFLRKSKGMVEVSRNNMKIALISEKVLINSIYLSISEFLDFFLENLPPDSAAFYDISLSLKEFNTLNRR